MDFTEVLLSHFQDLVKKEVAVPVAAMDALAGVIKRSDNVVTIHAIHMLVIL